MRPWLVLLGANSENLPTVVFPFPCYSWMLPLSLHHHHHYHHHHHHHRHRHHHRRHHQYVICNAIVSSFYLPLFVRIISLPMEWNCSHRSLFSSCMVTFRFCVWQPRCEDRGTSSVVWGPTDAWYNGKDVAAGRCPEKQECIAVTKTLVSLFVVIITYLGHGHFCSQQ